MGPNETVDPESLQKAGARRRGCLDRFLILSVIVLFAGLAALAAAGALVVQGFQSQLQQAQAQAQAAHPEFKMPKVIGDAPENTFKMQNFAYLEATSSELTNQTIPLDEIAYLSGKSVGSNFEFISKNNSLQVKQAGSYFLYVELNVTCVSRCKSGLLSVHLSDTLSCAVHLPNCSDSEPIQKRCWTVKPLNTGTILRAQMSLPHGPLPHWKLELRGSGFGMFLLN